MPADDPGLRKVRDRRAHVQRVVLANGAEVAALQGDPPERRVDGRLACRPEPGLGPAERLGDQTPVAVPKLFPEPVLGEAAQAEMRHAQDMAAGIRQGRVDPFESRVQTQRPSPSGKGETGWW